MPSVLIAQLLLQFVIFSNKRGTFGFLACQKVSNTFYPKNRPELPFLTASRFKVDDVIPVPGKIRYGSITRQGVGHSGVMPIWEEMKVQPVAVDIYADNAAM